MSQRSRPWEELAVGEHGSPSQLCVYVCVCAREYVMVCTSNWCEAMDSGVYMSEYHQMERLGSSQIILKSKFQNHKSAL